MWLANGNAKKYSQEVVLSCIDRISEYAVCKKISSYSLWEYTRHDVFKLIYSKLLEAKLLRITDRNTHKVFIVAGQLYLRFLKEKPWKIATSETFSSITGQLLNNSIEPAEQTQTNHAPTEEKNSPADSPMSKLVFRKEVDWSLLHYGFTIPQTAIDLFCSNIDGEIQRGGSRQISLSISDKVYPATLSNIGLSSDSHQQMQVRYSLGSYIAASLCEIFSASYDFLAAAKNTGVNGEPIEGKEYADVVCVSPNIYGLVCFPLSERPALMKADSQDEKPLVQANNAMTIKNAVIHVLNSELRPMTVEGIYEKIVEQQLYTFGAKKPVNVVRTTIEYACENSGYLNRNAVSCFRFERNNDGKKVYSLLTMNAINMEVIDSKAVYIKENADSSAYAPQKVSDDEFEAICTCLMSKYSNGFRFDSQIELNKLRRYLSDRCDIELALSDVELSNIAKSCGTIFEDKVYVVNTVTRDKVKSLVERYFDNGGQAIFYEAFFSKHANWLIESSVVSEEMLITLFRRLFPQYFFTMTYFGTLFENINTVIVSEMLRVWDYDILLNYDELSERLAYIPRYRIEFALGQNREFVWNSTETFTHISKVDISDGEKATIYAMVTKACNIERFISFVDLPLDDIAKRNRELTETAIHTATYQICLAEDYERRGKIITRRGDGLSALEIITAHCRTLDRATLQELLDFEKELTGEVHRWVPMQAGYDAMVRISEDDYIAEKYIHFNIPEIDAAIENFMMDEYIPLRAVTTFALFPHCGQPWNLFLLESYARRFSVNFGFATPSVNNKNAGCIVRRNSKLTYDDIMVDAILKAKVQLTVDDVTDYLFNNGYRGSRQKAKVSELIKIVKQLRQRRS